MFTEELKKRIRKDLIHTCVMLVNFCRYSEPFRDYAMIRSYEKHVRKLLDMLDMIKD